MDAKMSGKELPEKLPKCLMPEKIQMRRTKSLPTDLSLLEQSSNGNYLRY